MTTKFHTLAIIHPHSGEVSRSVIERLIINAENAYPPVVNGTRSQRAKWAAAQIKQFYLKGEVHLEDSNGKVSIRGIF